MKICQDTSMNMKLISRDFYLRQLEAVRDIPDIKVITGKSSLMDAFSARIAGEAGVNVVRINLNLKRNIELRQPESLYEYVESRYRKDLKNYLFIDEVQMCQGFEEIISSIHEESIYDIYLTGSNAFLLSSDLATLFGGRVFEISIFPACDDQHIREDKQNPIMMYTPAPLNLFFDIMKPVLNLNISERELRNIISTHPGIFPSQPTNSHNTSRFKGYLEPYLRILPRPQ